MSVRDKPQLTAERARELFRYDPDTGRIERRHLNRKDEHWVVCKQISKDGYVRVTADDRQYLAHRVAFLLQTGRWPAETVDHINRIKTDNRWENLREATHKENHANRPACRLTDTPGVYKMSNTGRYFARPTINGRRMKFGTYDTPEQAAEAIARRKAGMLL